MTTLIMISAVIISFAIVKKNQEKKDNERILEAQHRLDKLEIEKEELVKKGESTLSVDRLILEAKKDLRKAELEKR